MEHRLKASGCFGPSTRCSVWRQLTGFRVGVSRGDPMPIRRQPWASLIWIDPNEPSAPSKGPGTPVDACLSQLQMCPHGHHQQKGKGCHRFPLTSEGIHPCGIVDPPESTKGGWHRMGGISQGLNSSFFDGPGITVHESAEHDINARLTLDGVDDGWIH